MQNVGKAFEADFKNSVPDYCLTIRLPDPPQAFTQRSDTRFSHKNPCDFLVFDTKNRILYTLELKTTQYTNMSFEDITLHDPPKKMIHKHQILGLAKFDKYDNIVSGFILNFRDDVKQDRTYFLSIANFNKFAKNTNKSSINELDIILYNGIKIDGKKLRTRYRWDIEELFAELSYNS